MGVLSREGTQFDFLNCGKIDATILTITEYITGGIEYIHGGV